MDPELNSCRDEEGYSSRLRALHDLSLELSTLPDPGDVCRRAVEWGLAHLGFDRLSLWFIDPDDGDWNQGTWGTDEAGRLRDERRSRVRRDALIAPPEFYEGKVPVLHYRDEPCYDDHRRIVGRADKALAPLWDGRKIIGEMAADNFLTHRPIVPRDLDILVVLARIVAHLHSLAQTRDELAQMGERRGTLLKELKHRTRNNLNVILGLVTLESLSTENDEVRERLDSLRDRVAALEALYGLLDHETKGQPIRLDEYLTTVAHRLSRAQGADVRGVAVEVHTVPVSVDGARAGPLGIALNELLTDGLKYAFPGGRRGRIEVGLAVEGADAVLTVRDDGPGLPPGFDPAQGSGLGLGLVMAIAQQVGGQFSWANGPGAWFTLRFPVSL